MNKQLAGVLLALTWLAASASASGALQLDVSDQGTGSVGTAGGDGLFEFEFAPDYPVGSAGQTRVSVTLSDDVDSTVTTL